MIFYVAAVFGTAQVPGASTTSPLAVLGLAVVTAFSVAASWRWPSVGLVAGVVMLLVVLFTVLQGVSWTTASQWLNPFEAVGFGDVSEYPTKIAAAILTARLCGCPGSGSTTKARSFQPPAAV